MNASIPVESGPAALTTTTWMPLELAAPESIELAVRTIADDLLALASRPDSLLRRDPCIGRGTAGACVFLAYWAQHLEPLAPDESAQIWASVEQLLADCLAAVHVTPHSPSLFAGYCGIAWTVEHLFATDDDALDVIDGRLPHDLAPLAVEFDVISGLAGLLVYGRERGSRSAAWIEALLDRLSERAEQGQPCGRTWFTGPDRLGPDARRASPQGHHDLGLAHGTPGVLAALAGIADEGLARASACDLIDDAMAWLLAQPTVTGHDARYAALLRPGSEPSASRLGWCYGDLAVAFAMVRSGRARDRMDWIARGVALARHAAERDPAEAGVVDASLCHGAAGLAHMFSRMHSLTGDPSCRDAARHWYADALGRRQPGRGVGGFAYWAGRESSLRAEAGLLEGAAGIGLSLLGAIDTAVPAWDRLLLLS